MGTAGSFRVKSQGSQVQSKVLFDEIFVSFCKYLLAESVTAYFVFASGKYFG